MIIILNQNSAGKRQSQPSLSSRLCKIPLDALENQVRRMVIAIAKWLSVKSSTKSNEHKRLSAPRRSFESVQAKRP